MFPYLDLIGLVHKFWDDHGPGVLIAVLAAVVVKLAHLSWQFGSNAWRTRKAFGISGNWIGTCELPSYGGNASIEIWRYATAGHEVKLAFFSYTKTAPGAAKWLGHGVFRNNKLSAYYYELDRTSYESGVIVMEMKGARLKGTYAQFDSHSVDESFFVSDRNYVQARLSLPLMLRARMWVGLPPVRSYAEAEKWLLGATNAPKTLTQAAV